MRFLFKISCLSLVSHSESHSGEDCEGGGVRCEETLLQGESEDEPELLPKLREVVPHKAADWLIYPNFAVLVLFNEKKLEPSGLEKCT